jgi:hypothetical protein
VSLSAFSTLANAELNSIREKANYVLCPTVGHKNLGSFQVHVDLTLQVREGFDQIGFAGLEVAIHSAHPMVIQNHLLEITRPKIESDVNYAHADVSLP